MKKVLFMLLAMAAFAALPAKAADKSKKEPDTQVSKLDKEICDSLAKAFDYGNRVIAMTSLSTLGDNSAPRETTRKLEINNQLLMNSMNLTLMVQNKCPLPREVDSSEIYQTEAVHCLGARIKGASEALECDLRKWKGSAKDIK